MIYIDPFQFSIAAFTYGFIGSIHCIGMCGPIALALPLSKNPLVEFVGRLLYNLGRTLSYIFLGLISGIVGIGANLMGVQNWLAIASGLLLILLALFTKGKLNVPGSAAIAQYLQPYLRALFQKRHLTALTAIGILNGFLPCGFVYSALAAAMNGASLTNAALFMSFFGLGTLPAMLTTTVVGSLVSDSFKNYLTKFATLLTALLGLLLILRGLGLSPIGHGSHH